MSSKSGIYQILNLLDGKVYVGKASLFRTRWGTHRTALRRGVHCNPALQSAWSKYGEQSFRFEVLEEVSDPTLLSQREGFYCNLLNVFDRRFGYNLEPIDPFGVSSMSNETKRKMSVAKLGKPGPWAGKKRPMSQEHIENLRAAAQRRVGIPRSETTCQKVSEALTGLKRSEETRRKISQAQFGKKRGPLSEETRRKISQAHQLRHRLLGEI